MSSEFEEKELDFKNQQKVLFPGMSQSRPRPGSGQEKRQGDDPHFRLITNCVVLKGTKLTHFTFVGPLFLILVKL